MKERPILFNGAMVRAILEGRKTQTRRIVKPQPVSPGEGAYFDAYNGGPQWNWWAPDNKQYLSQIIRCPFGQAGDRLWVRETFGAYKASKTWTDYGWEYDGEFLWGKLDRSKISRFSSERECFHTGLAYRADPGWGDDPEQEYWRPSIHMPRWASRITLEISGVRVERLQSISTEDALAEGAEIQEFVGRSPDYPARIAGFSNLWRSVYGAESWQANPWVWVVEFRNISKEPTRG